MKIVDLVEEFIVREGYFDELKEEFYYFKVNQIVMYMVSSHSEDYFQLAKKKLLELDYKDIEHIGDRLLEEYNKIINSSSFENYMLLGKIKKLENSNKKLKRENKSLKAKNKKLSKTNKKITSSNSWKATKPLRTLNSVFKR